MNSDSGTETAIGLDLTSPGAQLLVGVEGPTAPASPLTEIDPGSAHQN